LNRFFSKLRNDRDSKILFYESHTATM